MDVGSPVPRREVLEPDRHRIQRHHPVQLIDHPDIVPGSIHSDAIVNEGADKYLYLAAVAFVRQVYIKNGAILKFRMESYWFIKPFTFFIGQ